MSEVKFIDLCAGLGGFHRAAHLFGQEAEIQFKCVLAAELDGELRRLYAGNFPEMHSAYKALYPPERTRELQGILEEEGLADALPEWTDDGELESVHGDMAALVNSDQTGLRLWPGGKRDQADFIVPRHDLLFAGFPCQPFSKSGRQLGFAETRGTVFDLIRLIIRDRRPRFVLLENVGNFDRHDQGKTWSTVRRVLSEHYEIRATRHKTVGGEGLLSPHHLGYPHHRERFFIIAQRRDVPMPATVFPDRLDRKRADQRSQAALARLVADTARQMSPQKLRRAHLTKDRLAAVDHWNELLGRIEQTSCVGALRTDKMISSPIWAYELDPFHWYPLGDNPRELEKNQLVRAREGLLLEAKGNVLAATNGTVDILNYPPTGDRSHLASKSLGSSEASKWIEAWPAYAGRRSQWPRWKQRFIDDNRRWALWLWTHLEPNFFREWIDLLFLKVSAHANRKLEWNCKGESLDLYRHILQFRPSGIRVKRFSSVPALVAMTSTQVPVIPYTGKEGRRSLRHLTPEETLILQGFPRTWKTPRSREKVFRATGNAVHCRMAARILAQWLGSQEPTVLLEQSEAPEELAASV